MVMGGRMMLALVTALAPYLPGAGAASTVSKETCAQNPIELHGSATLLQTGRVQKVKKLAVETEDESAVEMGGRDATTKQHDQGNAEHVSHASYKDESAVEMGGRDATTKQTDKGNAEHVSHASYEAECPICPEGAEFLKDSIAGEAGGAEFTCQAAQDWLVSSEGRRFCGEHANWGWALKCCVEAKCRICPEDAEFLQDSIAGEAGGAEYTCQAAQDWLKSPAGKSNCGEHANWGWAQKCCLEAECRICSENAEFVKDNIWTSSADGTLFTCQEAQEWYQSSDGRHACGKHGNYEAAQRCCWEAAPYILVGQGANACPARYEMVSKDACVGAAQRALYFGASLAPGLTEGNWSYASPGCSFFQSGGVEYAIWNHLDGNNNGQYLPVCKVAPYTLADLGKDRCPAGYEGVSKAVCLGVAQRLLPDGTAQGRTYLVDGSWSWVPPGCSVQSKGDWAAYWNQFGGDNDGNYAQVCQKACWAQPYCESGSSLDSKAGPCPRYTSGEWTNTCDCIDTIILSAGCAMEVASGHLGSGRKWGAFTGSIVVRQNGIEQDEIRSIRVFQAWLDPVEHSTQDFVTRSPGHCGMGEVIYDKGECAKAAQALGFPSGNITDGELEGCRYEDGRLTFKIARSYRVYCAYSYTSWCICANVKEVLLQKPAHTQPDIARQLRCDAAGHCADVFGQLITLVSPWVRGVMVSDFQCPLRAHVAITTTWSWQRLSGNLDRFEGGTTGLPSVSVMVNELEIEGEWRKFYSGSPRKAVVFKGYPAEGNLVTVRLEVDKTTDLNDEDTFRGTIQAWVTTAHMTCEEKKVCIKTLAEDDQLRVDNALQLRCLDGELHADELHADACNKWQQCLEKAGVTYHLRDLLKAAVQHPDDFGLAELAETGVEVAQVLDQDSAEVPDQKVCKIPKHMDTEAWYCLCLDEMDKACYDIKKNIPRYDHTMCLQANACYDPFETICASWKNEKRRCKKLKAYTRELEKHQRAALLQRANSSAHRATTSAGADLDNTVSSKAHQCNH